MNRACSCGLRTPDGAAAVPSGQPGSASCAPSTPLPLTHPTDVPDAQTQRKEAAPRSPLPDPVSAASPDLSLPQVCFRAPAPPSGNVVNKAEVDVFLELSSFFDDPRDVGNLISGSSAFSKFSLTIWKCMVHVLLKPGLENFENYFISV